LPAGSTLRPAFRKLDLTHDAPRVFLEYAPGIGELHSARQTVKKLRADFTFELLYLLTEGWLSHAETLRGSREVPFLGDDHKVFEVAKFHINLV
jgi:hypothetical protein